MYHMGRRASSRHAEQALRLLNDFWFSWAGTPRRMYIDPAGEFRSEELLEHLQGYNTRMFVTSAPWQRGRIKRHGDLLKHMLQRLDVESPMTTPEGFDQILIQCFQAKNSLVRHQGYSPEQIVLGKATKTPGSICSDEALGSHALTEGTDLEAERHRLRLCLRCKARQAFLEADNAQSIRRAMLRRSTPLRGPFPPRAWVLYWLQRKSPNRLGAGRWHGPAKVVFQEGQSEVWISHETKILRCAPENLRPASVREWQEAIAHGNENPLVGQGGASTFLDLSQDPAVQTPVPLPLNGVRTGEAPGHQPIPELPELPQPEQELTPQVSQQPTARSHVSSQQKRVEIEGETSVAPSPTELPQPPQLSGIGSPVSYAPSAPTTLPEPSGIQSAPTPEEVPLPESGSEDLDLCDQVLLSTHEFLPGEDGASSLLQCTSLVTSVEASAPPLAEDNLPYIESPLECGPPQAFVLEIDMRPKDLCRWLAENSHDQLASVATAGKRCRAEVRVKDLTVSEQKLFEEAKAKEIQCWLQTSAVRGILRAKLNPEQILRSRWVLTWKDAEEGQTQRQAKARLVVLGFQDPKLVEVTRDAPTLSKEGRSLVLQTLASRKFRLSSFDIKTAFLRGKADSSNPLAMDPPAELRKVLKLKQNEVCELLGNAYGRVDAPLLFYKELCKQLEQLGFVRHPLEPCVFLLYKSQVLSGILGMQVDDGIGGGDVFFQTQIDKLEEVLPFGSRKFDNLIFTGIHLEQLPNFSIRASQENYVHSIPQIDIGRVRRQQPAAPVNDQERSKFRSLRGGIQYAATHTRPDIAAKVGSLQSLVTKATVQTLLEANKVLREAQTHSRVHIYFQPIDPKDLTFVSFGDASFASSRDLNSHQGVLICATSTALDRNQEAPISPWVWVSKRIPRVVRSTLSAEAYSMSKAVDVLGWCRSLWGCVHIPEFPWQNPEKSFHLLQKALVVTDCKSLYDLVTRLAMPACEEYRATLEVLLIKQRCRENASFKWIPTTLMPADCLTKSMDSTTLRAILSRSFFRLYDPDQSLEKNAQRRDALSWLDQPTKDPGPS